MVECYDSLYLKDKLIGVSRRVEIGWKLTLELYSKTGPPANMKSHESETIEQAAMDDLHRRGLIENRELLQVTPRLSLSYSACTRIVISIEIGYVPVAQLDRVLPSEDRGHRFESCQGRQHLQIILTSSTMILRHYIPDCSG